VAHLQCYLTTDKQNPLHHLLAAASEAVFFGSLSAEEPLNGNAFGFFTLSFLHGKACGRTRSIPNCSQFSCGILEWQSFSSIRKQEIILTCLRMRHSCLTYVKMLHLLLHIIMCHTSRSFGHLLKKCQTFSLSRKVAWHPRR
jgi:hypothetical protein